MANLGNNGLCDVRSKPCRNLVVSGDNFADNPDLVCHFEIFKVSRVIFLVSRAFVCGNDILLSKFEHVMIYNLWGIIKYQRYGSLQHWHCSGPLSSSRTDQCLDGCRAFSASDTGILELGGLCRF